MAVYPLTVHGRKRWLLDTNVAGERIRRVFSSKTQAEEEEKNLNLQRRDAGDTFSALAPAERAQLVRIATEFQQEGISLQQVRDRWKSLGPTVRSDVTLTQAIRAVVDAKTASGKSQEYVTALRGALNAFAKGRNSVALAGIGPTDVEAWLAQFSLGSRVTYRARLSTLFRFQNS